MIKTSFILLTSALILKSYNLMAQDSSRVFFTTGAGIIKSPGSLSNVFHPSIAFNSGIELVNRKDCFIHGTLDFNTLKYNQQVMEDGSPYLFQNTKSSLVMIAVSTGKNLHFGHHRWFASFYAGGGYLNIGEPRLKNHTENIIQQEIIRKTSVFGKAGARIGLKTRIKFLQSLYFDAAYWASPITVQGSGLKGLSLFIGTRMSMKHSG